MRRGKVQLKVLPTTTRQVKKVPKPQVKLPMGDPLSRRGAKARIGLSVPGIRTP
jgi:hypothetical protein